MRVVALAWVWVVAPLELATALTSMRSTPLDLPGVTGLVLMASRGLTVAVGLILGRQLAARDSEVRQSAVRWALLDLGTLALVLASDVLPSNRLPGTGPLVWLGYAILDGLVVLAARSARPS